MKLAHARRRTGSGAVPWAFVLLGASAPLLSACPKPRERSRRDAAADPVAVTARVDPESAPAIPPEEREEILRQESAELMPEGYEALRIGRSRTEVLASFPSAKPLDSRSDPERLHWHALEGEQGLQVRLGFDEPAGGGEPRLRSVQFLSLLLAPAPLSAPSSPENLAAWQSWMEEAYRPLLHALGQRYGEKADVYTCRSGGQRPLIRVIWSREALAVTAAFYMHEKGLSTTLVIAPREMAERYVRATDCRWMQDRLM